MAVINLAQYIRVEKRRGFQPPWYKVYIYKCPVTGKEMAIRGGAHNGLGGNYIMPPGAVMCSCCPRDTE